MFTFSWERKSGHHDQARDDDGRFASDGGEGADEEPQVSDEDATAFARHDDAYAKHTQSIQDLHDELADHVAKMEALKAKLGKATAKANEHVDALNGIREKYGYDALEKEGSALEHGEEVHDALTEALDTLKKTVGEKYGGSKMLALAGELDTAVKAIVRRRRLVSRITARRTRQPAAG